MERKLQQLFDLQHFAENKKLKALIDETMNRYSTSNRRELLDEELALSAAGNPRMANDRAIFNGESRAIFNGESRGFFNREKIR